MDHLFVVESVAELRTAMPGSADYVQLAGHTRPGDGGGGLFFWISSNDPAADDNGVSIRSVDNRRGVWRRMDAGPVSVKWFGAGEGQDDTQAVQSALNVASQGGTVLVPAGVYQVSQPLLVHQGTALLGDGLLSVFNYSGPAATGCLGADPKKSAALQIARLNIMVQTAGAYGLDLRGMSYSRFDDLHIHLRADGSSGFYGPGNTMSPYYNVFTACHVAGTPNFQSNRCVGFNFAADRDKQDQSANSNTVIGGRISTCQDAVRCLGTGNMFYGQVLESGLNGYVFDIVPNRVHLQQAGISNDIVGCYSEHVANVIVQRDARCYVNALLTMVTGYKQVFDAKNTANCIVITSHDGSLPQSRSFVHRRIDFKQLRR